jgi:hypothetical protein
MCKSPAHRTDGAVRVRLVSMRAPMLLLLLAAAGCSFKVPGIGVPPEKTHPDLSPPGLVAIDMAVRDASIINILDMLAPPPDMSLGLQLSHVPQHFLDDGTCDLTVAMSISTSTPLQVDGVAVPSGCVFTTVMEGGTLEVAVLAVKSFTVNGNVKITGSRPLVIVAGDTIAIMGTLDGAARNAVPGPGGGTVGQGASAGKDGSHADTYADSGGGGAGALIAGSKGGDGAWNGATAPGGAAGAIFGGDLSVTLPGGSSGGKFSSEACAAAAVNGGGGAGGGSIQLSARRKIDISGNVNAGGGGGLGGCVNGTADQGSGGGGGAGGAIWVESPSVKMSGGLWANGGSGGGAAEGLIGVNGTAGGNGNDGPMSTTPAAGGTSPGMNAGGGATGGTGNGSTPSSGKAPGMPTAAPSGMTANAGGGGGSAGTITIRYKGSASLSSNISPAPQLDPTVP